MNPVRFALSHNKGMWFGVLVSKQKRLVASAFSEKKGNLKDYLFERSLRLSCINPEETSTSLVDELASLFDGKKMHESVDFETAQLTSFQERVHRVLMNIPKGKVTTYGRVASVLGSGPRAVGNAVGSNPWPLFVPCHRVIPSSGFAGNYSMNGTVSNSSSLVKQEILRKEGVQFVDNRVVSSMIWHP